MTFMEQQEMLIGLAKAVIENRAKWCMLASESRESGDNSNPNYVIRKALYGAFNDLVWDFKLEELDI